MRGLNKLMHVKCLEQCLTHSKASYKYQRSPVPNFIGEERPLKELNDYAKIKEPEDDKEW